MALLHKRYILAACLGVLLSLATACAKAPDSSAGRPGAVGNPKAGMRLLLDEDFEGKSLNKAIWNTGMPWDAPSNPDNGNLNIYQDSAVALKNGVLMLWARKAASPVTYYTGQVFPYSSGMVQSAGHFALTYGYIEMRAKMPSGKGMWGGFWLLPAEPIGKWPPEIDGLEHHGDKPEKAFFSLHFKDESGEIQHDIHEVSVPPILDEYHTYGLLWEPGRLVWYLDGREMAKSIEGVPNEPMYVLLNLAVGGNWPGKPDANTRFPISMDVDYLKIWQKK